MCFWAPHVTLHFNLLQGGGSAPYCCYVSMYTCLLQPAAFTLRLRAVRFLECGNVVPAQQPHLACSPAHVLPQPCVLPAVIYATCGATTPVRHGLVLMSVEAVIRLAMEPPLKVVAGCGPQHLLQGAYLALCQWLVSCCITWPAVVTQSLRAGFLTASTLPSNSLAVCSCCVVMSRGVVAGWSA